jgi:hypothetical protein
MKKKLTIFDTLCHYYFIYAVTFLVCYIIFMGYTRVTLSGVFRHTYQLPSTACTGSLVSDWGDFNWWREMLFEWFLIPFCSIALMLWIRDRYAWALHVVLVVLFMFWAVVNFGYDIDQLIYANVDPGSSGYDPQNYARSYQYCLYYAGQPGTSLLCANPAPCALGPAVDPNNFNPNTPFLLRFVWNVLLIGFMVFDLWIAVRFRGVFWTATVTVPPPPKPLPTQPEPPKEPAPPIAANKVRYMLRKDL